MHKKTWPSFVSKENLDFFIKNAFLEDVGGGDHSTLSCIPNTVDNSAKLLVKEDCFLAGIDLAEYIFNVIDPSLRFEKKLSDGQEAKVGDIAFYIQGNAQSILTAERLVLNCMQRMSGIATKTNDLVKKVKHTNVKLLDTRKTTPNFRICEKWAVKIGGGENHRYGLYDMIMLKDNHVDFCGGIEKAVSKAKVYLKQKKLDIKIEVETRNIDEVKQALVIGVDRIMLDNMSVEDMSVAVALIGGKTESEASGNISSETVVNVAETGVDYISMGALTHSADNKDLSLKAV